MRKILFFLLLILLSGCKKQFVQMGWVSMDMENIIKTRGLNWKTTPAEENLQLYFEATLTIDREETIDDIEDAYEEIIELLGFGDYDQTINIFLLKDSSSMKMIQGTTDKLKVHYKEHVILMVMDNAGEDDFERAFAQLMLQNLWGETQYWMLNGYSYYISQADEDDENLHEEATQIFRNNEVSLSDLFKETKNPGRDNTLLTASFVKFLLEEYGKAIIKSLWLSDDLLTDDKISELEGLWKRKISGKEGE